MQHRTAFQERWEGAVVVEARCQCDCGWQGPWRPGTYEATHDRLVHEGRRAA